MKHWRCGILRGMNIGKGYYAMPVCGACAEVVFRSNVELARWLVIINAIATGADSRLMQADEFVFWNGWLDELTKGAFSDQDLS